MWGFLQWQIGPALDVDYALSLRLYSDSGEIVYQADNKIRKLANHTPTQRLDRKRGGRFFVLYRHSSRFPVRQLRIAFGRLQL